MKPPAPDIIDMDVEKLETLLRRAENASLSAEDTLPKGILQCGCG